MMTNRLGPFLLAAVAILLVPDIGHAQTQIGPVFNFEADLPGVLPNSGTPINTFKFYGPTVANNETTAPFEVGFSHEILATGGVGGTQAYTQNVDGTNPGLTGGPGYWYGGVGAFHQFATTGTPLAGGAPGSNNPSRYRFSADVKVTGGTIPNPLIFTVLVNDFDYESTHNIDINNDMDLSDGADLYRSVNQPTLTATSEFQTVSFTLDQGMIEFTPNILPQHQGVFSNEASMLWSMNWGAAQFGLDAGNSFTIDNVRIDFFEQIAVPGDYNGNSFVDAADYVVWRDNEGLMGGATVAQGDGTGDGNVTTDDYLYWRERFGNTSGSGAGLSTFAAVPEPGALLLCLTAAALVAGRYNQRRKDCASAR